MMFLRPRHYGRLAGIMLAALMFSGMISMPLEQAAADYDTVDKVIFDVSHKPLYTTSTVHPGYDGTAGYYLFSEIIKEAYYDRDTYTTIPTFLTQGEKDKWIHYGIDESYPRMDPEGYITTVNVPEGDRYAEKTMPASSDSYIRALYINITTPINVTLKCTIKGYDATNTYITLDLYIPVGETDAKTYDPVGGVDKRFDINKQLDFNITLPDIANHTVDMEVYQYIVLGASYTLAEDRPLVWQDEDRPETQLTTADLIIIPGSIYTYTEQEIEDIRRFVKEGGSVLFMIHPRSSIDGNLETGALGLLYQLYGVKVISDAIFAKPEATDYYTGSVVSHIRLQNNESAPQNDCLSDHPIITGNAPGAEAVEVVEFYNTGHIVNYDIFGNAIPLTYTPQNSSLFDSSGFVTSMVVPHNEFMGKGRIAVIATPDVFTTKNSADNPNQDYDHDGMSDFEEYFYGHNKFYDNDMVNIRPDASIIDTQANLQTALSTSNDYYNASKLPGETVQEYCDRMTNDNALFAYRIVDWLVKYFDFNASLGYDPETHGLNNDGHAELNLEVGPGDRHDLPLDIESLSRGVLNYEDTIGITVEGGSDDWFVSLKQSNLLAIPGYGDNDEARTHSFDLPALESRQFLIRLEIPADPDVVEDSTIYVNFTSSRDVNNTISLKINVDMKVHFDTKVEEDFGNVYGALSGGTLQFNPAGTYDSLFGYDRLAGHGITNITVSDGTEEYVDIGFNITNNGNISEDYQVTIIEIWKPPWSQWFFSADAETTERQFNIQPGSSGEFRFNFTIDDDARGGEFFMYNITIEGTKSGFKENFTAFHMIYPKSTIAVSFPAIDSFPGESVILPVTFTNVGNTPVLPTTVYKPDNVSPRAMLALGTNESFFDVFSFLFDNIAEFTEDDFAYFVPDNTLDPGESITAYIGLIVPEGTSSGKRYLMLEVKSKNLGTNATVNGASMIYWDGKYRNSVPLHITVNPIVTHEMIPYSSTDATAWNGSVRTISFGVKNTGNMDANFFVTMDRSDLNFAPVGQTSFLFPVSEGEEKLIEINVTFPEDYPATEALYLNISVNQQGVLTNVKKIMYVYDVTTVLPAYRAEIIDVNVPSQLYARSDNNVNMTVTNTGNDTITLVGRMFVDDVVSGALNQTLAPGDEKYYSFFWKGVVGDHKFRFDIYNFEMNTTFDQTEDIYATVTKEEAPDSGNDEPVVPGMTVVPILLAMAFVVFLRKKR